MNTKAIRPGEDVNYIECDSSRKLVEYMAPKYRWSKDGPKLSSHTLFLGRIIYK